MEICYSFYSIVNLDRRKSYVTSLNKVVNGLSANTKYTFKVTPYFKNNGTYYYGKSATAYETINITTAKKGTKLAKVGKPSVAKSGTSVKVSWKNISGETGYQISRATSSTGTSIVKTYKTSTGKSYKVSAAKGKTYYYKVKAYRDVNGKRIYGAWSSVKSFKRK